MIFDEEVYLEHYGVKGMRWGVRRKAKKDAKEFSRAKQFYGEGAGTRRKLIKAKVEGRSKSIKDYEEAYNYYMSKQNTSKHAEKAISERRRKDAAKTAKQTTGYVARRLTGEMGTKAAFTAVAIGGIAFFSSPKGQRLVSESVAKINSSRQARNGAKLVKDFMKSQGR